MRDAGRLIARRLSNGGAVWDAKLDPSFGELSSHPSSPAVVNGVVYAGGNNNGLYAVNEATGAAVWGTQLAGGTGVNSPAVVGNMVYATYDSNMAAVNATTGAVQWIVPASNEFSQASSAPTVANHVAFVATEALFAYDATTGHKLWSKTLHGYASSNPVVADHLVIVATTEIDSRRPGDVSAYDPLDGHLVWSQPIPAISAPAVTSTTAFVTGLDGNTYGLDAVTGARLWKASGQGGSAPSVANGVVYVGGYPHPLAALNAATGSVLWQSSPSVGTFSFSSPGEASAKVVMGDAQGGLFVFGL